MKSVSALSFLVSFWAIAASDPSFQYQKVGCSPDVCDYVADIDLKRDCQTLNKDTWKEYVDCVTEKVANLKLALQHCQEDVHSEYHGSQAPFYYDLVCPATASQAQFSYHVCIISHALMFSKNTNWDQFLKMQSDCAASVV